MHMNIVTLNEGIVHATDKHTYPGQRRHSLAFAYDARNCDAKVISTCAPQRHDIPTDKACASSPFFELHTHQAKQ
eukprot:15057417-Alexandrium_andersonii.AAC.1